MVKPHNKRKKQPRSRAASSTGATNGGRTRRSAATGQRGRLGANERAPAKATRVAPAVARFDWDRPTGAATGSAPVASAVPAPMSAADRQAAALAFIAALPGLPGDLATLEGFLPGAERPQLLSAAALSHLRGEVPPELAEDASHAAAPMPVVDPADLKKHRISGQLAGLAFLIAGFGFAGWTGQRLARDAEATHWRAVPGVVTLCKSELISRKPDRYEPLFAYRYKVGSTWLTGSRVRFAGGQGDPVQAHRVGEKLKVYVDPKAAKISVLAPGVIGWAWAQLIAGLVVAALGGLYLMLGGRER